MTFCISNQLLSDVDAAGPGTAFWVVTELRMTDAQDWGAGKKLTIKVFIRLQ